MHGFNNCSKSLLDSLEGQRSNIQKNLLCGICEKMVNSMYVIHCISKSSYVQHKLDKLTREWLESFFIAQRNNQLCWIKKNIFRYEFQDLKTNLLPVILFPSFIQFYCKKCRGENIVSTFKTNCFLFIVIIHVSSCFEWAENFMIFIPQLSFFLCPCGIKYLMYVFSIAMIIDVHRWIVQI